MISDKQKQIIKDAVLEIKSNQEVTRRFSPSYEGEDGVLPDKNYKHVPKESEFKDFGHYINDVIRASVPNGYTSDTLKNWQKKSLTKAQGELEEGVQSMGGFTVPVEYSSYLFNKVLERSIVRPRARFQSMMSNQLSIPCVVDSDHSASYYGGILIQRGSEGGQMTATNPTYENINLNLHKVYGLVHISNELLEDSAVAIEQSVTRQFVDAIAFVEDDDFINGTGASQPLGVANSANGSLITVDAISGQGANTLIAENIRDMYSRMHPAGLSTAVWLANPDTFGQLFNMVLTVGAGGVPVWMPAGGVSAEPYRSLMGLPLILTEKCQTLGTAGDIILADFSQYVIGGKNQGYPNLASSIHLRFDYDQSSFRFTLRYDGQSLWNSALVPKYSSTTVSPWIVLNSTRT